MFEGLKSFVKGIQAMAQRRAIDPLNYSFTTPQSTVRKNNFTDYKSQLEQILKMYYAKSDYGASLTKSGVTIRSSFIAGEGISITGGSKKSTADWIENFLKYNKLKGSKHTEAIKACELEGKMLFMIKKIGDTQETQQIKIKIVKYSEVGYKIHLDEFGDPEKVTWEEDGEEKSETKENFEYINYEAYDGDVNDSPPPIASCVQQIINYERALYDMRANNHLFGRITPIISGKDNTAISAAVGYINSNNWTIGKALPINGTVSYLAPEIAALESLRGEMSLNLKIVSSTLGIPVHWQGWTDLMSNRSTAETLSELVETMTKEIRLKWIETYTSLIRKAMVKSQNFGGGGKDLDGFDVELPQITAEKIKELIDAWFILTEAKYVSKEAFINKLPGIDPEKNKKQLEKEAKEEEEKRPPQANAFNQNLPDEQEDNEGNQNE